MKLSKQFVAVAEEVHFLYPEGEWALSRIVDEPAHKLFKHYGTQVPKAEWNDPGTKQGIYMMGPKGEYLEGAHAASGNAGGLAQRLERALERWDKLRKKEKYANKPVTGAGTVAPPSVAKASLALRVFSRDLPRGGGDDSGRRAEKKDMRGGGWLRFTEWAWNQNWFAVDDPLALVPKGKKEQVVDAELVMQIARRALIDNVRGQNGAWAAEDVKSASLTMHEVSRDKDREKGFVRVIEYSGTARMNDGKKSFAPTLHGRAEWSERDKQFLSFELVAVGERAGAARFNQRENDKASAPMGVLLELYAP